MQTHLFDETADTRDGAQIRFYSVRDEYGEFSNFSCHPIRVGGGRWPTTEHYFQAQKFAGTPHAQAIRLARTPSEAARLGRSRKIRLRRDWDSVKIGVMRDALRAKLQQHDDVRDLLLATGDAKLIEHTANDSYWGDGGDGTGKNMLGRLLMELRDELRPSWTSEARPGRSGLAGESE